MIGLVLGIFVGWLIHELDIRSRDHHVFGIETATLLAFIRSLSTLFLNLIKSIIAPLIFATLVIGIAGTGDIKQVGRIGVKVAALFRDRDDARTLHRPRRGEYHPAGQGRFARRRRTGQTTKPRSPRRPRTLAKEASEAAKKAEEFRTQQRRPAAMAKGEEQAAIAIQKSTEAADAASKGLTAPDPPAKPQEIRRHHRPSCRRRRSSRRWPRATCCRSSSSPCSSRWP